MESLLKARWPITMLTAIYTVAAIVLTAWARSIGLPTRGGISPSEVLEGVVPGGLTTLLVIWILLMLLTLAVWVITTVWIAYRRRR
jgi:hypothetical protein